MGIFSNRKSNVKEKFPINHSFLDWKIRHGTRVGMEEVVGSILTKSINN